MSNIRKYLRLLPAAYFMVLGLFLLIADLISNRWNTPDLIYAVVLVVPIIIRRKWLYGIFGMCSAIVFTLFLFVLIKEHVHYAYSYASSHQYNPADFIAGYLLIGASLAFSAALLYMSITWQESNKLTAGSD